MARLARIVAAGVAHHITQRGNRRQTVFFSDDDYRAYLGLLREWSEKEGLAIWAHCLMPNHVHIIGVPETEPSLWGREFYPGAGGAVSPDTSPAKTRAEANNLVLCPRNFPEISEIYPKFPLCLRNFLPKFLVPEISKFDQFPSFFSRFRSLSYSAATPCLTPPPPACPFAPAAGTA